MQFLNRLKQVCAAQRAEEIAKQHVIDDKGNIFKAQISPLDGSKYMPMRFPTQAGFDYDEELYVNGDNSNQIVDITAEFNGGKITVHYASGSSFTVLN